MSKTHLSDEFIQKWQNIIGDIEDADVPIEYIDRIDLHFKSGQKPAFIDISQMLETTKPWKLEKMINDELERISEQIDYVNIHLNIEKLADIIDTETNKLLKNL